MLGPDEAGLLLIHALSFAFKPWGLLEKLSSVRGKVGHGGMC